MYLWHSADLNTIQSVSLDSALMPQLLYVLDRDCEGFWTDEGG